jgi:hypothetical protein
MGTRADFYVKKEKQLEWIASIAWDGYPNGIDKPVLKSKTEKTFRSNLQRFLNKRTDVTYPKDGWPWPWNDSRITDYAYIFEKDKVQCSCFGSILFDPLKTEPEDLEKVHPKFFPDMSKIKNVAMGNRFGIIISTRK